MTTDALDFDRLDTFVAEGRLLRGRWKDTDEQGRERACLMAALYPACGEKATEKACPAALMPAWLSSLSVWIDDNGTDEAWLGHVKRYAKVIRGVVALPSEALEALSRRVRVIIAGWRSIQVTPSRRPRNPAERAWPAEGTAERLERCKAMLRLHPACGANGCKRVFGVEDGIPPCGPNCFKIKGRDDGYAALRERGKDRR